MPVSGLDKLANLVILQLKYLFIQLSIITFYRILYLILTLFLHQVYIINTVEKTSIICIFYFLIFVVVRDQDGHIYLRESNGCILAGGFEPNAKPAFENMPYPGDLNF